MNSSNVPPFLEARRDWVARSSEAEQELLRRDEHVSFAQANSTPALLAVTATEGIWITDASGRRYRDFYGNNCHHVGYQHPRVLAAVREQLERYCFVSRGLTAEPSIALAEQLLEHYPGPESKVLFVPGGGAAVELALMIAKVHTGRHKTISFWDAYHGRSAGALSVGGSPRDKSPRLGPLVPGALHAPPFYWFARSTDVANERDESASISLKSLEAIFKCTPDIAALIAEPIRNGPYIPPSGYWPQVRELCNEYGALLIFDEIPMGLGKTGRLFNSEHFGVAPDMTLLGKALGGAVAPLAAVIAAKHLDTAPEMNLSYYTHEKNAFNAAAGLATLSIILDEKLPAQAARLGQIADRRLSDLRKTHRSISRSRSIGAMFALDLDGAGQPDSGAQFAQRFYYSLLERGVLAMPPKGNTVSFSAPLITSEADFNATFEAIDSALGT